MCFNKIIRLRDVRVRVSYKLGYKKSYMGEGIDAGVLSTYRDKIIQKSVPSPAATDQVNMRDLIVPEFNCVNVVEYNQFAVTLLRLSASGSQNLSLLLISEINDINSSYIHQ